MNYGSVCSGIEAASVAWESLGWKAQWYSEIEPFPSAVLAHRFPSVPNLGDMTKIHETQFFNDSTINILVGGTPCQSFSVAGLRKGLADPRGNLMLTFLSLAQRKKPRWIVWENVPGVLSSNGGRDFSTFLQALAELGYGFAYRVLDAQYFGVAQRRRRVFVVGYLGDWRPAGAVLFEQDCLSGNTKKGREKRKATPEDAQGGSGGRGIPRQSGSLDTQCRGGKLTHQSVNNGHLVPVGFRMTAFGEYADDDSASTLKQRDYKDATDLAVEAKSSWWNGEQTAATLTKQNANGAQRMPDKDNFGEVLEPTKWISPNGNETVGTLRARDYKGIGNDDLTQGRGLAVAHAFKVRGGSEVETGEQGGTPGKKAGKGYLGSDEPAFTIGTTQDQQIAYEWHNQDSRIKETKVACTLNCNSNGMEGHLVQQISQTIAVDCYNQTINEHTTQTIGSSASDVNHYGAVLIPPTIRRLTPRECERLQGFPDDWTLIPYRNKPAEQCPDGPRYKACGNSMAVPVMRWIGQRIQMVENLINKENE